MMREIDGRGGWVDDDRETSTSIALWAEQIFGRATALSTAIRAQVELTELISKLQRLAQGRRGEGEQVVLEQDVLDVMAEVADVQIVLARIQRFFHRAPTVEEAVEAKMRINRKREWNLDGHGHGQHTKYEGPSFAALLGRPEPVRARVSKMRDEGGPDYGTPDRQS